MTGLRFDHAPRFATAIVVLLVTAFALSSCANTIRGMGRDINESADAIEDSVE